MPKPINKTLYNHVKNLASKKFKSLTGIYRSSWIVREYKKRGGKYSGSKTKSSGLKRWYKEGWIDLNRPIRNSKNKIIGYHKCGRKSSKVNGPYPLCRPSRKITNKTHSELYNLIMGDINNELYKYNDKILGKFFSGFVFNGTYLVFIKK